jgi:hypothetical protein
VHWKDALHYKRLVFIAAASAIMFTSCDLFTTREPQPPDQSGTALPPATTPDQLYSNIQQAISLEDLQDYEKLLSDQSEGDKPFTFVPDQSAAARYAVVFSHWTRDSEGEYFQKAMASIPSTSSPQVAFDDEQYTSFSPDSGVFSLSYTLFLNHNEPNLPTTFKGRAFFYVSPSKSSGIWTIYRWEDIETSKDSSWSELKGYFGQ